MLMLYYHTVGCSQTQNALLVRVVFFCPYPLTNGILQPTIHKAILEYNITFPSIEKTGRKPCSIREHIIGIVMVSERDSNNVTFVWSCDVYAL